MKLRYRLVSFILLFTIVLSNFSLGNIFAKEDDKTLRDFLKIALEPVGSTMYVWGGGWNEEDTGAGIDALTLGVSPRWEEFFNEQDSNYDFNNTRYQIRDGLDCSGYIGWALYNLFPRKEGYVMKSTIMAKTLTDLGMGSFTPKGKFNDYEAGDILSTTGHVWISLGKCNDGSVVILHASPSGVMINGTQSGKKKTDAVKLAEKYMSKYYPKWHSKYPDYKRDNSYLTQYNRFRWNKDLLKDPENYRNMTPEEILEDLFLDFGDSPLVRINNKEIKLKERIINKDDRYYYPFRELVEYIGGNVYWDSNSRTAVGEYGKNKVEFRIGENYFFVNGEKHFMDSKSFISWDKTYIPLRYLYEGLGFTVKWNEDRSIDIFE